MAFISALNDLRRAKELRELSKTVKSPGAKDQLERAAQRMETRGATKASKLGKRSKRVSRAKLVA